MKEFVSGLNLTSATINPFGCQKLILVKLNMPTRDKVL